MMKIYFTEWNIIHQKIFYALYLINGVRNLYVKKTLLMNACTLCRAQLKKSDISTTQYQESKNNNVHT